MKTERSTRRRRALTRYSAEDRERLIREQTASGETKKAFCEREGINLGSFHGWAKRKRAVVHKPRFAEVELATSTPAAIEVLLPNGSRIGIRHEGKREDLIALVRGVAPLAPRVKWRLCQSGTSDRYRSEEIRGPSSAVSPGTDPQDAPWHRAFP